jgi:hypothetical protein
VNVVGSNFFGVDGLHHGRAAGGPSSFRQGFPHLRLQRHLIEHSISRRIAQFPPPVHSNICNMSEERGKGISLRKKRTQRTKGPPSEIPPRRQPISGPMPVGAPQSSGRPSQESNRSGRKLDAPRERPQRADKTAELVKRRYSQRITQLPADFGNGAPMPAMPQLPAQYRVAPPSRDGRPPGTSDGSRALQVDMRALRDPDLVPEQCG